MTLPILPGTDGERRMSKSLGNYVGVTEPPEEIYGKTLSVPDAALPVWRELLFDEPRPARADASPRDAKRALAREIVARFHGPAAAERAEAHFDRVHVEHRAPDDVRGGHVRGAQRRGRTSRPWSLLRSGCRRLRRGGCRRRAACASTASRWGRTTWTCRLTASTARCCRSAGAGSAACAGADGARVMPFHAGMLRLSTRGRRAHRRPDRGSGSGSPRSRGLEHGVVTVFAVGATVAVTTMEYEPGGVSDLTDLLERLVPRAGDYAHNRLNHDTNSHAHMRAAFIGPSESGPARRRARLTLGTWQQIVLIDFDDRPRQRTVHVQVAS